MRITAGGYRGAAYILPFSEEGMLLLFAELSGGGVDSGDSYEIAFCEMTEEEYKALPEFDGF